jgi:uncharacterized membrane protein
MKAQKFTSAISQKTFPVSVQVKFHSVDHLILEEIHRRYPNFSEGDSLSIDELNDFRREYVTSKIIDEFGAVNQLNKEVIDSIQNDSFISEDDDASENENLIWSQRLSDKVAAFGGSWTFIISFMTALVIWMAINTFWFFHVDFDPFPFIFLNLILSCIAALQAPIIMMSQNRQEEKDRVRAKKDFRVNLKAELEIRLLHNKLDHLMVHQQQELIEIQKIQMDMLNDILIQMKNIKHDRKF